MNPVYNYPTTGLPEGNDTLTLSAFLADIDNSTDIFAITYYKITPTRLIVQWNTVGYNTFDDDLYDNFQIIITNGADALLPPGNNVSYCYYIMAWGSGDSSGGSMGYGGVPAVIGVNKGDGVHYAQFGAFDYPTYTFTSPFDTTNGYEWLDDKSYVFNTCVTGNTIPPVIVNPDSCNKYTICLGDTLYFNALFLCPQHGQTLTISDTFHGLRGINTVTNRSDSLYRITGRMVASFLSDTGTHIITLTATDNSTPPLTNSREITVTVLANCGDTALGVTEITNPGNFSIYPNPNGGKFTIQSSAAGNQPSVIEIYNVLGEKVFSKFTTDNSQFTIDLSSRPAGMYLYRVTGEDGSLLGNGKFIIR